MFTSFRTRFVTQGHVLDTLFKRYLSIINLFATYLLYVWPMPICMQEPKMHLLNCFEQVVQQMGPDMSLPKYQILGAHFHGRSRAACHLRGTACSMSSVAQKTDVTRTSDNSKRFERPVGIAGQSCAFVFGHSPMTLGWTRDLYVCIR